jgi:hypothetical protein
MKLSWKLVVSAHCIGLTACASQITLAPGADHVTVTKNPANVTACAPRGEIAATGYPLDQTNALRDLKNQTVGAAGDTLLITYDPADHVLNPPHAVASGIAYRCK